MTVGTLFVSRRSRWLARLALYTGALLLGLPFALSQMMIRVPRQPAHAVFSPFEENWIQSDGLRLRTWMVRGVSTQPAVVVAHGLGDTLESFTGVAERMNRRGHTVLLLDLRAHGASEGRDTTLGGREREDVRAAMDFLRRRGLARSGFVLMGYSMGAVAVVRAAAREPETRAVMAEAPFDSYRSTMAHHARLFFGMPEWLPLTRMAVAVAEWRAGFDADAVDAVAAAREMRAPLLAIADGADPRMPEPVVRRVFDAHPGPKEFWLAPGAEHAGASALPEYWPRVLRFLEAQGVRGS